PASASRPPGPGRHPAQTVWSARRNPPASVAPPRPPGPDGTRGPRRTTSTRSAGCAAADPRGRRPPGPFGAIRRGGPADPGFRRRGRAPPTLGGSPGHELAAHVLVQPALDREGLTVRQGFLQRQPLLEDVPLHDALEQPGRQLPAGLGPIAG